MLCFLYFFVILFLSFFLQHTVFAHTQMGVRNTSWVYKKNALFWMNLIFSPSSSLTLTVFKIQDFSSLLLIVIHLINHFAGKEREDRVHIYVYLLKSLLTFYEEDFEFKGEKRSSI